ncbi:hypothetical protein RND71_026499 [Anisodus tanguticus]|uniref:Uncharacterized protein n=1 Tax=Anisodus tanguticus TaxID=243964 RepID=A0AAE1RL23_9SOLA|nr:hypothetical protein RND71_026499 [Anisodus tanguticus]
MPGYVHERAMNQAPLQHRFRDIYSQILNMRWILVFEMLGPEMINVQQFKSKRLSFGNTLTLYFISIDDNFPKPGGRNLPRLDELLDISNVKGPKLNAQHHLTLSKERSAQSTYA